MRRKVITQGNNSFTLTLPVKWARKQGISGSSEVDIAESGKSLVIAPTGEAQKKERSVELNFSKEHWEIKAKRKHKYVQRVVAAAYKAGFDEIVIRSDSQAILDYIEKRIETFIGIEIIDQGKDYFKIKNLVSGLDGEFDKIFRRALTVTKQFAVESYAIISSGKYEELHNLLRLEKTQNKITDFCKRLMAVKGYPDPKKERYFYSLIAELERIVDDYKSFCDFMLKYGKTKMDKDVLSLLEVASSTLAQFCDSFYRFDTKTVYELTKDYCEAEEKAYALVDKEKDLKVLHYLINILRRSYEMGEAYIEMNLGS